MVRLFRHYVCARLALLVCLELVVLASAVYFGAWFHYSPVGAESGGSLAIGGQISFPVAMLLVATSFGLYDGEGLDDRSTQIRFIGAACLAAAIAFALMAYRTDAVRTADVLVVTIILAILGMVVLRFGFHRWSASARLKSRTLVLGTGSRVLKLLDATRQSSNHLVVGYLETKSSQAAVPGNKILQRDQDESLLDFSRRHRIQEIVVGIRDRRDGGALVQELLRCKTSGIRVTELSTFFEREHRQVILESLNPSWMVFGDGFRQNVSTSFIKRIFDVVVSTILVVATAPILLVTMLGILIESGFPIFYKQERVGQDGKTFTIFKLRTMCKNAEGTTPVWAATNDSRTTRFGRFLRKFRIDELPQILNVLRGDMSFVGPRPERPYFVQQLSEQIPYYGLRHTVKPGITGWAQVRFSYGASMDDAVEKLQHDLYYVKNNSLFLDFVTLLATVEVVLSGKGAR